MDPNTEEYKKLRLQTMASIQHPEGYYQQALASKGVDYRSLSHAQISVWVAQIKCIEADIMIQMAFQAEHSDLSVELMGSVESLFN